MDEKKETQKKAGRPVSGNRKDKMVRIRVTEDELKELKKLARDSGMTVSEFFRFLVWGEIG